GLQRELANFRDWLNSEPRDIPMERLAWRWHRRTAGTVTGERIVMVARDPAELLSAITQSSRALTDAPERSVVVPGRVFHSSRPLGPDAQVAFVFPGSGNHYPGMGLAIGGQWPRVLRRQHRENARLQSQVVPELIAPWLLEWPGNWEADVQVRMA